MRKNESIDGWITLVEDVVVPFNFENGKLTLFFGAMGHQIKDEISFVVGQKRENLCGGNVLFHFPVSYKSSTYMMTTFDDGEVHNLQVEIGSTVMDVDYYIEGFESNSIYNKMRFSFPELDDFLSSLSSIDLRNPNTISFKLKPQLINDFTFHYKDKEIRFTLQTQSVYTAERKVKAETKSELVLCFESTTDYEFMLELFRIVYNLFCFICNRTSISLREVEIIGERLEKGVKPINGPEIKDKVVPVNQQLVINNRYGVIEENNKLISRIPEYSLFSSNLEGLVQLIANDSVSISSIHSSTAARNLLDLKHCLNLTAAFEYYQRTFLPQISSESTLQFVDDIHGILQEYINKHSGKVKNKAKDFLKHLDPAVSLKEKIRKVIYGYGDWEGVENIISEWFKEYDDLAEVVNDWRNELAHEKREYEPDIRVIYAIRLVEHLNYCIVLRASGYTDKQIKAIIKYTLVR